MVLYLYFIIMFVAILAAVWFVTELILFLSFKGEKKKAIKGSFIASAVVFGVLLIMFAFIALMLMIAIRNM